MLTLYTTAGLNKYTGYGKLEIGLLNALRQTGIPLSLRGPFAGNNGDLPSWAYPLLREPVYDTVLITANPEKALKAPICKAKNRIFLGMSESDKPGLGYVNAFEELGYKLVLVTCPDLEKYYAAAGVKCPVKNVDMGVDYETPNLFAERIKEWRHPGDEFVFMAYTYGDRRKGAQLVMQEYFKHFADKPGVKLWIKAREDGWIRGFDQHAPSNIRVIFDELSEAEWIDLLQQTDCFVFPSYGEGFGLPPREAVLAGVPTIATQWLGLHDAEKWAMPIKGGHLQVADFDNEEANAKSAKWFAPNADELGQHMKVVYEMTSNQRLGLALRGRHYLLQNFTWQKTAQKVLDALKTIGIGETAHDVNSTAA